MTGRPTIIGVTGGIGSGKSAVVDALVRRGAVAFSADSAVHELYGDAEVRAAVIDRWGDRVRRADGSIDRAAIAEIVFVDADERAWLEGLLHPLVAREWLRFLDRESRRVPPPAMVVAEVPLLFEAGLESRYDATMAVVAPLDLRLERVGERASGSHRAADRASIQLGDDERVARATHVIVNDGTLAQLQQRVDAVITQLTPKAPPDQM